MKSITACYANDETLMEPPATHEADGFITQCYVDENNVVTKESQCTFYCNAKYETNSDNGCNYDGQNYPEGETIFDTRVANPPMSGMQLTCVKNEEGSFFAQASGMVSIFPFIYKHSICRLCSRRRHHVVHFGHEAHR
jgi:hypothetical protein